jgi:hypothetical protein
MTQFRRAATHWLSAVAGARWLSGEPFMCVVTVTASVAWRWAPLALRAAGLPELGLLGFPWILRQCVVFTRNCLDWRLGFPWNSLDSLVRNETFQWVSGVLAVEYFHPAFSLMAGFQRPRRRPCAPTPWGMVPERRAPAAACESVRTAGSREQRGWFSDVSS